MVDESPVANWMTGRLQVFFEGSWSQVCSGRFEAAEASVACRQLGFGAGTIFPQFLSGAELGALQSTPVFPEIAITASGCTGTEERLVDCDQGFNTELDYVFRLDCLDSLGAGLVIACVGSPGDSADCRVTFLPCLHSSTCQRSNGMTACRLLSPWRVFET